MSGKFLLTQEDFGYKKIEKSWKYSKTGEKIGSTAKSRNPKAALSSFPDVILFYHTGKRLYLGKSVYTKMDECFENINVY